MAAPATRASRLSAWTHIAFFGGRYVQKSLEARNSSQSRVPSNRGVAVLERPKLIDQFLELSESHQVVVLYAPAASGKSVLLEQLAQRLRFDDHHLYVDLAIPNQLGSGSAVVDLLAELRQGEQRERRTPGLLILDSADVLAPGTLRSIVRSAADSETRRIVMAVRSLRAVAAAMFDSSRTAVLDAADLALDSSEARALLKLVAPALEVSPLLEEVADGHIGTLIELGKHGFRTSPDRLSRLRAHAFAAEITTLHGQRYAEFVRSLSLVPSAPLSLAAEFAGESASMFFELAESLGHGSWIRMADGSDAFAFSPFVRFMFTAVAQDDLTPQMRVEASRWAAQHGGAAEAVRFAVSIRDLDLCSELLVTSAYDFLFGPAEKTRAIVQLIAAIPLDELIAHPILLAVLAIAATGDESRQSQASELWALAAAGADANREIGNPIQRALMEALAPIALSFTKEADRAESLAGGASSAIRDLPAADRRRLFRIFSILHDRLGLIALAAGEVREAISRFEFSCAEVPDPGSSPIWLRSSSLLAAALVIAGELPRARRILEQLEGRTWPGSGERSYLASMLQYARGELALDRGNASAAIRSLDEVSEHEPNFDHWVLFAAARAKAGLGEGKADAALRHLDSTVDERLRNGWVTSYERDLLRSVRVMLLLELGRAAEAFEEAGDMRENSYLRRITNAEIALAEGHDDEAAEHVRAAAEQARTARERTQTSLLDLVIGLRREGTSDNESRLYAAAAALRKSGATFSLARLQYADRMRIVAAARRTGDPTTLALFTGVPMLTAASLHYSVTQREGELLRALADGATVAEIVKHDFVTKNTVKTQLRILYRKLEVSSREDALIKASLLGLIPQQATPTTGAIRTIVG